MSGTRITCFSPGDFLSPWPGGPQWLGWILQNRSGGGIWPSSLGVGVHFYVPQRHSFFQAETPWRKIRIRRITRWVWLSISIYIEAAVLLEPRHIGSCSIYALKSLAPLFNRARYSMYSNASNHIIRSCMHCYSGCLGRVVTWFVPPFTSVQYLGSSMGVCAMLTNSSATTLCFTPRSLGVDLSPIEEICHSPKNLNLREPQYSFGRQISDNGTCPEIHWTEVDASWRSSATTYAWTVFVSPGPRGKQSRAALTGIWCTGKISTTFALSVTNCYLEVANTEHCIYLVLCEAIQDLLHCGHTHNHRKVSVMHPGYLPPAHSTLASGIDAHARSWRRGSQDSPGKILEVQCGLVRTPTRIFRSERSEWNTQSNVRKACKSRRKRWRR